LSKGKILVTFQFLIIFLMFVFIKAKSKYFLLGIAILTISIIIGLLAIKEQGNNDFNIRPDINPNCKLITTGVYKYIRHPMYFSVIFGMLGILVAFFNYVEFILYIFLIFIMLIKLHYEEQLWCNHTKEYLEYKKRTKKLIPFIY